MAEDGSDKDSLISQDNSSSSAEHGFSKSSPLSRPEVRESVRLGIQTRMQKDDDEAKLVKGRDSGNGNMTYTQMFSDGRRYEVTVDAHGDLVSRKKLQ